MRVFVAIDLPGEVKADIFHHGESLQKLGIVRGNFVEKENLHLTLKFLGELSEDQIDGVKKKLSEINFKKFDVKVGKVGVFPSPDYVRVVWVDLVSDKVKELADQVHEKLSGFETDKEKREFTNHVTIARINSISKSERNKEMFLDKLKNMNFKKLKFDVDKFLLIKSELTPKGPMYKTLAEFKFK